MIDLAQRAQPYEIHLPYGLKVTVKPLTTAGMAASQTAARRAVGALDRSILAADAIGKTACGVLRFPGT